MPSQLWLILSTYASFIEAQGWELVARYYQRRLDAPDDASSMDPTRYTLRAMLDCLRQAEEEGSLLPGWSVEWTADFFFRHFRGVVVDWVLHRGSYPLLPKLEQDYTLFREIFQTQIAGGPGRVGRASEAVYKPSCWRIRREGSCERLPRRQFGHNAAPRGGT